MKEVIVETARVGGGYKEHRPYRRDSEGFPDYPSHEKMRYHRTKNQGDKLGPLRAFLESKIGQQWDDVFSEICEVNDKRSMLGFHLLTHLAQYVYAPGLSKERQYSGPSYFQDADGTLQKVRYNNPWTLKYAMEALKAPIESFPLEDGWRFQKEKGQWYWMKDEEIPDTYPVEYIDEAKYEIVRVLKTRIRTKHWKFQCNRKALRLVRAKITEEVEKRRRVYAKVLRKYR
jgi:hypothetical protein